MARPQLNNLKVVRKILATGEVREYFSNPRTGQAYGTDRVHAQGRWDEWQQAQLSPVSIGSGTLGALIEDYYRTDDFKNCEPSTRRLKRRYLEQLRDAHGKLPVKLIDRPWVERLKLRLQEQPSKCNHMLKQLKVLLGWGVNLGYCDTNVARQVKGAHEDPRKMLWEPAQIDAFLAAADARLKLAFSLMLYTAQRLADVLAMTRGCVSEEDDGLYISLQQQKTDALLVIPVHPLLEPLLRARLAERDDSMMLVASPTGLPWEHRNFSRDWNRLCARLGLEGLQRRDLRRTAVVLMAQAGMPVSLIAQITGHDVDYSQKIIDTYLPKNPKLARTAMNMWAATPMPKTLSNIVTLASRRRQK